MSEYDLQTQCNDYLRELEQKKKLLWWHRERGRTASCQRNSRSKAFPDIVIQFPGNHVLNIELKSLGGKLNAKQIELQDKCKERHISYYVVDKFTVFVSLVNYYMREYKL